MYRRQPLRQQAGVRARRRQPATCCSCSRVGPMVAADDEARGRVWAWIARRLRGRIRRGIPRSHWSRRAGRYGVSGQTGPLAALSVGSTRSRCYRCARPRRRVAPRDAKIPEGDALFDHSTRCGRHRSFRASCSPAAPLTRSSTLQPLTRHPAAASRRRVRRLRRVATARTRQASPPASRLAKKLRDHPTRAREAKRVRAREAKRARARD